MFLFFFFCSWTTGSHMMFSSALGVNCVLYSSFLLSLSLSTIMFVSRGQHFLKLSWAESNHCILANVIKSLRSVEGPLDDHQFVGRGEAWNVEQSSVENIERNSLVHQQFTSIASPLCDEKRCHSYHHDDCISECRSCNFTSTRVPKTCFDCRLCVNSSNQTIFPANMIHEVHNKPNSISLTSSLSSLSSTTSHSQSSNVIHLQHMEPHPSLDSLYEKHLSVVFRH